MPKMRIVSMSALLFYTLLNSACSPMEGTASPPDVMAAIPRTMPSIIGQITAASPSGIVVEENPAEEYGSAKAHVAIIGATQVLHQKKGAVAPAELQVGQQVRVWFTGPVMESYPLQATAGMIVIESSSR